MIYDVENWLWKSDLGTVWQPMWISVKVKSKNHYSFTDFFAKAPVDSRSQNFTTEVTLPPSSVDAYVIYEWYLMERPSSTLSLPE